MIEKITISPNGLKKFHQLLSSDKYDDKLQLYLDGLRDNINDIQFGKKPTLLYTECDVYEILLDKCRGIRIISDGGKIHLHNWLQVNLPLYEIVTRGNGINKKLSQIKFNKNVIIEEQEYSMDKELIKLANESDPERIFELYYHNIISGVHDVSEYESVKINTNSLTGYIQWLDTTTKFSASAKKYRYQLSHLILNIAKVTGGFFLQKPVKSPFGRTYYERVSIQSVPKDLRSAMLGYGYEYDINNSVLSWKLWLADAICKATNTTVKAEYPSLYWYHRHREDVHQQMYNSLSEISEIPKETMFKMFKQVFTAFNFGARMTSASFYFDAEGQFHQTTLADIIKCPELRREFCTIPYVLNYLKEINQLDNILCEVWQDSEWYTKSEVLRNSNNRVSKPKAVSFVYQRFESKFMEHIRSEVLRLYPDAVVLGKIHDAVIFNRELETTELNDIARFHTNSEWFTFSVSKIKPYVKKQSDEEKQFELDHKAFIAAEEIRAKNYVPRSSLIQTSKDEVSIDYSEQDRIDQIRGVPTQADLKAMELMNAMLDFSEFS